MFDPLNPILYRRLKRIFKSVKVSNEGQAMVARDGTSIFGDEERPHLDIVQEGEYYLVCCPYCGDTRHRLNISHMFGQRADSGRRLRFLAICFNENCLSSDENRQDFQENYIDAEDEDLEEARIKKGKTVNVGEMVARLPGPCKALHLLNANHPARRYLESRRFDPDRLSKFYGVSYCSDSLHTFARRRIIIPVLWKGKLVGWQARHVGELDWKGPRKAELPPKFFTMPGTPKAHILPNLHRAKKYKSGILVEGWFDVFGGGPMCMPVLGNGVSLVQRKLFATIFGRPGRSGALVLDPEEQGSMQADKAIKDLNQRMPGHVATVWLPPGTDPGKLDRSFFRDYVEQHAKDQGVKIRFDKVGS